MPELPEVETVRRGLEPVLSGHCLVRVEQRRADLRWPLPERFADRLQGRRIEHLNRRAKYLMARLSGGEVLVMHLGMSGRFTITPTLAGQGATAHEAGGQGTVGDFVYAMGAATKHDHVVFETDGGVSVTYNDPRRFGFMVLIGAKDLDTHPLFAGLGAEPLGNQFDAKYLAQKARGRRSDLKSFLMDQRVVAGLGNIYAAEALFRAGLSPNRAAACLTKASGRPSSRAERLVLAIRSVLTDAISAGGSTLHDYRKADGEPGYFQHAFQVYGRAGESCAKPGCRGIVRRNMQAGRSTFFCGACQR